MPPGTSQVIEQAHQRVRGILSGHRKVLADLARLVSQKEVVQGEELRKMLGKTPVEQDRAPHVENGEKVKTTA